MNRIGHETATFFVGGEVEKTPAYSRKTLFVVGEQSINEIKRLAKEQSVSHVFLGANHSFDTVSSGYWDKIITELLDNHFWVTLDYPAHKHNDVLKLLNKGIWQSRLFIPLLNVCIPYVQTSNANLTIKIDDIDFKATNAGVWCLNHHEITDSNRFTDWVEYGSDSVISTNTDVVNVLETKTRVSEDKNNSELGLDLVSKSALKPEEDTIVNSTISITTPNEAAEAYAKGTTQDPLSSKSKGVKVKR